VAKARPRKIEKHGDRFKATAVKLSSLAGGLCAERQGVTVADIR